MPSKKKSKINNYRLSNRTSHFCLFLQTVSKIHFFFSKFTSGLKVGGLGSKSAHRKLWKIDTPCKSFRT